jgi:hypothetical protein
MKDIDTKAAGKFAFAATMDAQRRNTNNKSLYSSDQIRKAVTVMDLIDTAFRSTRLYINYRKTFISVKAENARARDGMAKTVIKLFEDNGYALQQSAQGLIVHLT